MSVWTIACSPAVEMTMKRLTSEEGVRLQPYDDETGLTVHAPVGILTWGIGFNLAECGSPELFAVVLHFLLDGTETKLNALSWYPGLALAAQSAVLDIAYNAGFHGLLDFPHMIAALAKRDYAGAAAQCQSSNPKLAPRYAKLRILIASSQTSAPASENLPAPSSA